jgi:FtsP/CotA-like multicopper oxidase with cupredoxin domain
MFTTSRLKDNPTNKTERPAATDAILKPRYNRVLLFSCALLTLGSGAIHLSVMPGHFQEYFLFGLFFVLGGAAQLALAVATLLMPARRVFTFAALLAIGCLALWLVSRTVGLPIDPDPWKPEAVGFPDVITGVLESISVLLFGALLLRGPRIQARSSNRLWRVVRASLAGLAMLVIFVLVSVFSAVGVLAGLNPMQGDMNMGAVTTGQPSVSVVSLQEPPGSQTLKAFTLTARPATIGGVAVWTYNGTVPGPELRVTEGDRVRVTLINHLPASTTIHWHGLRLPNADDGVAGVTQDAIPSGGSFTYEFVVKDPGTYWYHSHQDTSFQIPQGLYGALVVAPKLGAYYDHDYAVTLGNLGHLIAANGVVAPGGLRLDARPGDSVRLRVINTTQSDMPGSPEFVTLVGTPYTVLSLDGHDLNAPQTIGPELLSLGAGQRYDLAFRMPASGQVRLVYTGPDDPPANAITKFISGLLGGPTIHNETVTLGDGPTPATPVKASMPAFDLTTYGEPAPDPVASRITFDVSKDLHIQTQGGFRGGRIELLQLLNGKASPNTDPIIVRPGQYVRIRFINDSDEYHPMHLHGHVFSVISKNGNRLMGSPVHVDSVLVGPHDTWEVAFLADNPGLWMLHCHVLIHANFGLSMMVNYEGISTPYTIGPSSGNIAE